MAPIQDLHGQDAPYPAGGGKNKINAPDITLTKRDYVFILTGLSLPAGTYTLSYSASITDAAPLVVSGENGDYFNRAVSNPATFTVDGVITGMRLYSNAGTYSNIQLEEGSSATAFAPYSNICPITGRDMVTVYRSGADMGNPQSVTVQLGETVFGGTLDVSTGKLTVTHGEIASYNGEVLTGDWISDCDVYAAGTTPTIGAQVVYVLDTPQTIDLDPQQITTLIGDNNVWSDAGDVALEYPCYEETEGY